MRDAHRTTLATCYRARALALAIVRGGEILEVRCHRIPGGCRSRKLMLELVHETFSDYAIDHIVVEADGPLAEITTAGGERITALSLTSAKHCLLGPGKHRQEAIFQCLLGDHPQLRRLVTILPSTKRVATSERRRTVQLLAVALALASEELHDQGTATNPRSSPPAKP